MNYFPFHVGDYAAHTAHLEPMEDLAYRRMLDAYYLREGPLPADPHEVARLVRMRANTDEVRAVLNEFFILTVEGWSNTRCDAEISRMQDKQAKARISAMASVNARRASVERTLNERSADVELPTPTPTPISTPEEDKKERPRKRVGVVEQPNDVGDQVWTDFVAMRKAKGSAITQTGLDGIKTEASKAGWTLEAALRECCSRGWRGFKAEWIAAQPTQTAQRQPVLDHRGRLPVDPSFYNFGRRSNPDPFIDGEVIDVPANQIE